MTLTDCPKCGDFLFSTQRVCSCRAYEVAILEHDVSRRYDTERRTWTDEIDVVDWREVQTKGGPQRAAELAVERFDVDTCEGITQASHVLVRWTDPEDLSEHHQLMVVFGEMVPEYHGDDHERFELFPTEMADRLLQHLGMGYLPDELRPHTTLGKDYYSPQRIAEREQRKRDNAEWERKRREREQAGQ